MCLPGLERNVSYYSDRVRNTEMNEMEAEERRRVEWQEGNKLYGMERQRDRQGWMVQLSYARCQNRRNKLKSRSGGPAKEVCFAVTFVQSRKIFSPVETDMTAAKKSFLKTSAKS